MSNAARGTMVEVAARAIAAPTKSGGRFPFDDPTNDNQNEPSLDTKHRALTCFDLVEISFPKPSEGRFVLRIAIAIPGSVK